MLKFNSEVNVYCLGIGDFKSSSNTGLVDGYQLEGGGKCGVWALGILKLLVLQCWRVHSISGVNVYCLGIWYI
jgi:hypothetical protein